MIPALFRWRYIVCAVVGIITLLLAIPISSLKIDNSVDVWFYDKDPDLKHYQHFLSSFGAWDYLVIAIGAKNSIYSEEYLRSLRNIEAFLKTVDDVIKVTSIANAKVNTQREDGLSYESVIGATIHPDAITQLRDTLSRNKIYRDGIIKVDEPRTSLMLIQVDNKLGIDEPRRIAMMASIRRAIEAEPAFGRYHLVGTPNINAELNKSSKRDMLLFYPLVSLFILIFAWLVFRTVNDLIITFSVVLAAIICSMGAMMFAGYKLNMVTILMGTVLLSLSMASVVHLVTRFHQIRDQDTDLSDLDAITKAVKELWVPCLGAAITTICGFLSLTLTHILPISLLGYFCAFGIFLAFIFTFSVGVVLLPSLWHGKRNRKFVSTQQNKGAHIYKKIANFLTRQAAERTGWVITLFLLAAAPFVAGLSKLDADSDYLRMFKDSTRIADDYNIVERLGFGTSVIAVHFSLQAGLADEETFRSLMRFSDAVMALAPVQKVITPTDMVAEVDKALSDVPERWQPGFTGYGRPAFAQLLLMAESSGNDDLSDYLSLSHKEAQIGIFTHYLSGAETIALKEMIEALIRQHMPNSVSAVVTGVPIMWANMDGFLFKSQRHSLAILAMAIFIVLLILLRSLPLAVLGLFVNFLPAAIILGLMGHLAVKIDIATILIGGIAMGIAVDDTMHVLWRYQAETKRGVDPVTAIGRTLQSTGVALVLTSVLLIGGFSVMTLSDFMPTANFGLYTGLMVLMALISDLVLLPALLCAYGKLRKNNASC